MSALGIASQPHHGGYWQTNDPTLACALGTLGFRARYSSPIQIIFDARRIINLVDKDTGEIDKCAHWAAAFDYETKNEDFGSLTCVQVMCAHEFAKVSQRRERGDLSPENQAELENWSLKCNRAGVTVALAREVQRLYDHLTNFMVITESTVELREHGLLKHSRLLHKGVAHVLNPLECEPAAQRRSERFFKNAK